MAERLRLDSVKRTIESKIIGHEDVPPDQLLANPLNFRRHPGHQMEALRGSLKELGWLKTVLVNRRTGHVIDGHARVEEALRQGLPTIPVTFVELSPEEERLALAVLDPITELATRDQALLDDLLAEVSTQDAGLQALLDELAGKEPDAPTSGLKDGVDPDAVPEPPKVPVTHSGDLYILGDHRLLCGDSTNRLHVERLMDGKKANLCLTDPPYGLGDTSSTKNDYDTYQDTKANLEKLVAGFLPLAQEVAPVVVLTPGTTNQRIYPAPRWTMAWFTPAGTGVGPWGFCCWQPILCYGKDPKMSKGMGSHPDAIVHSESAEKLGHPCTKPIKFWSWLMERTSEHGELIFEPFGGSGTTIIAAEITGRTCYGIELSPAYCDIIVKRWEDATGRKAERHREGER